MRIGYGKLGKALQFGRDSGKMQGGPAAPRLLKRLAERNPDHTFVILSKNDNKLDGYPPNISNELWPPGSPRASWDYRGPGVPLIPIEEGLAYEREVVVPAMAQLDGIVCDMGQMGTSHQHIPQVPVTWAQAEDSLLAVSGDRVHSSACKCLYTHPKADSRSYGASIVNGLNAFGDRTDGKGPVLYLCEDSRNFFKARDIKWATGTDDILAQHQMQKGQLHERFRDARRPGDLGFETSIKGSPPDAARRLRSGELWWCQHAYRHANLEFMILEDGWEAWGPKEFHEREPAGIATTAYWTNNPEERRSWLTNEYLMTAFPGAKIFGIWDLESLEECHRRLHGSPRPEGVDLKGIKLKRLLAQEVDIVVNEPGEFAELLGSWRVTLALPPAARNKEGGCWTTAKPWQCFAAGCVTFFVPPNDAQGWMLPSRIRFRGTKEVSRGLFSVRDDWTEEELRLAEWLRVQTPQEFHVRAKQVAGDPLLWSWLAGAQRRLLRRRWDEHMLEEAIEHRMGIQ